MLCDIKGVWRNHVTKMATSGKKIVTEQSLGLATRGWFEMLDYHKFMDATFDMSRNETLVIE